ncbi:hypothetical protein [Thiocapsa rosea]|uniref:Uncharacterized protein n=1 Tax=Thiocapsa rosea TaxID=69360 RepID=A0A495UKU1_9GAMM|nr:hypothetical protein [Thiocapsa rosea]RKT37906.1 hypothetical protein BDD21_5417 [Thiocapsa rosea]
MNSPMSLVMLAGSRDLAPGEANITAVVADLVADGSHLVTGCATGADAQVIRAALAQGAPGAMALSVLAAHGPVAPSAPASRYSAPGSWSGSAVTVVAAAQRAGASVSWWSGGGPDVDLRARLARRSLAAVRLVAASSCGSCLVAWPSRLPSYPFRAGPWPSCGSGTWASVTAAARLGVPVVVFPVGAVVELPLASWPALAAGGSWSPITSGVLAGAAVWSPPSSLDLFA